LRPGRGEPNPRSRGGSSPAAAALAAIGLLGACTGEITTPAGQQPGPSDVLYAADQLPRFDLDIPAESMAALEAAPDQYAPATFRYGDEEVASVGVHLKGEWTFRPITAKASFKIKFDAFVADQSFRGLRRMTLNNGIEDESLISERLTYAAFRAAGLPAPRCNNAEVWVNGEYWGVYVNIETEDKTFLRRWFGSDDGNLYEELGNDWQPGNEYGFELETNETADDRSDLTALFDAIAGADDATLMADVSAILDTDAFLRYSAMEGIVNQWDGYAYTVFGPNNYRIYHDPSTGRFSILPWGMDLSLKPLDGNDYVDLWSPSGLLLDRCVHSEPCRSDYAAAAAAMAGVFEALDLPTAAAAARAQVSEPRYRDPRVEYGTDRFENAADRVQGFVGARPAAVRAQLP